MQSNYLQEIMQGNIAAAQRLAGGPSHRMPTTTLAEAVQATIPQGLQALLEQHRRLSLLYPRIEDMATPLQAALTAQRHAGTGLQDANKRLKLLQALLPPARFAGFVQAMTIPAASLQERVQQFSQLLTDTDGGGIPAPPGDRKADVVEGDSGFTIGDQVIAHVSRPEDPARDAEWWAQLPPDRRFEIWMMIIMLVLALLAVPGNIKDARDLMNGAPEESEQVSHDHAAALRSSVALLEDVLTVQQQNASRDADFQRQSLALQRDSRMLLDSLVARPCEVTVATEVRQTGTYGRPGRSVDRLLPGDLVRCMGHRGKWLDVAYDNQDGERVYGMVRKKHLTWD